MIHGSQNMPDEYEGKFASNEWNATNITAFHTGPDGYHWALLNIGSYAARCRKDMIPFLQTETITVNRATGLAALGRGQVKFAAFVPNGMGWFLRYSNNCCIYGPEITDFPSTFQSIVQELETTHPRKDECIDFVAFGLHDLLLARFENGKSAMFVPDDEKAKEQISKTLLEEVEKRLEEGWTFGNRTTLCGIDSERWFIEWKRGSQAEYRYSMGIGQSEDLQRVSKVLSAPEGGSGGGGNTAELIAANSRFAQQVQISSALFGR